MLSCGKQPSQLVAFNKYDLCSRRRWVVLRLVSYLLFSLRAYRLFGREHLRLSDYPQSLVTP